MRDLIVGESVAANVSNDESDELNPFASYDAPAWVEAAYVRLGAGVYLRNPEPGEARYTSFATHAAAAE